MHFFRQRDKKKVRKMALSSPQGQLHHTSIHPPSLKCSQLLRMEAHCRSPKEQETIFRKDVNNHMHRGSTELWRTTEACSGGHPQHCLLTQTSVAQPHQDTAGMGVLTTLTCLETHVCKVGQATESVKTTASRRSCTQARDLSSPKGRKGGR